MGLALGVGLHDLVSNWIMGKKVWLGDDVKLQIGLIEKLLEPQRLFT